MSSKNNLSRNIQDGSTSTKSPQKKAAVAFGEAYKGQLISKCPFGFFKSTKKATIFFVMISALTSKKRSTQKKSLIK